MSRTEPGCGVPAAAIDVTAETCPMTYVRTRLALDRLSPGEILEVRLRGAEPERNVRLSATRQGHELVGEAREPGGELRLLLRRGGGSVDR